MSLLRPTPDVVLLRGMDRLDSALGPDSGASGAAATAGNIRLGRRGGALRATVLWPEASIRRWPWNAVVAPVLLPGTFGRVGRPADVSWSSVWSVRSLLTGSRTGIGSPA